MKERCLYIGRWKVIFYFATEGYDIDFLMDRLYTLGAGIEDLRRALDLMESGELNTGFTFPNPYDHEMLVAIGPTSSGEEFINTLVHEVHLYEETPAYIAGDSARDLAGLLCELGCSHCRK